ncbi:transposable element Tcb1 transposase [Trichonephila clavipes]|nr:transposable element Tcb1 transposase [Trichonephila clavipes]
MHESVRMGRLMCPRFPSTRRRGHQKNVRNDSVRGLHLQSTSRLVSQECMGRRKWGTLNCSGTSIISKFKNQGSPQRTQYSTNDSKILSRTDENKQGLPIPNYHTHLEEEYANYRKPPDDADKQKPLWKKGRKHLDHFLRDRIIGRLECGRTQQKNPKNLESPRVSSPGFGNESKMMVMLVNVAAQIAPELQRRMRTSIWQLLTKRNRRSTASDLSRQLSSATGTTVSRQTMYRRLGHIGL